MQHLPAFFFRDYGDRFQKFVLLRGPSGQVWPVNLCVSCGSITGRPTVRFSRGWKTFALDHDLQEGDKLIFTLVSFSRFSVQVFDGCGTKKPTASAAISGWAFRREGLVDGVKQRRSFYVNWKEKTVRESALGHDEEPKKGKIVANLHTKASLLLAHVKGAEKFKMERRTSSSMYRGRNKSCFRPRPLSYGRTSQKSTALEDTETEHFLEIQEVTKDKGDGFDKCLDEGLSRNKDSAFPWSSANKQIVPSRCVHQDHEGTTQSPDSTHKHPDASETFSFAQCVSQRRPGEEQFQFSDQTAGNGCTRLMDEEVDDPLHVHYKTREKLSANRSDEMLSDPGPIIDNHLIHHAVPDNFIERDILADVTDLARSSASLSLLHHDPDLKPSETHIEEPGLGGCSRLKDVSTEIGGSPAGGLCSRPPRTNNIRQVECNGRTRSEGPISLTDAVAAHTSSNQSPHNLSLSYFFNQPRPRLNVTPSSTNGDRDGGESNSVNPMSATGRDQGEPPSSGVDQICAGVSISSSIKSEPNRRKAAAHTPSSLGFTDKARILDEQPRKCEKSGHDDCRRVDRKTSPRRLPGDAVEQLSPCVSDIHQMDSSDSLRIGPASVSDTQNVPTSPKSDISLSHYLDQPAHQEPKAQSSKIFKSSRGLEACNPLQQRVGVMRGSITKRHQPPPSLKSDNEHHTDRTGRLKRSPSSKTCIASLPTNSLAPKGLSHRCGQQVRNQPGVSKKTRRNQNTGRSSHNFLEIQPLSKKSPKKKLEGLLGIDHLQQLRPAARMMGQIMRDNVTVPALSRGNASVHNLKKQGRQVKQRNWKGTGSPSVGVSASEKNQSLGTEGDGWNTWMDIFRRNAITS